MIKPILGIALIVAVAMLWHGCNQNDQRLSSDHWYVEPADNFQWRACLNGGCGTPGNYNDALWWVTTEGGTKGGKLIIPTKSSTTGNNSPIINGNGGSVVINGGSK